MASCYLVIGISTYDGIFCISEKVETDSPEDETAFREALSQKAPGIDFEKILVLENGDTFPEVVNDLDIESQ